MRHPWIWLLAASGCTSVDRMPPAQIELGSLHDQLVAYRAQPRWIVDPDGQEAWVSRTPQVAAALLPDRIVAYHPAQTDPSAKIELATVAWGRGSALVPLGSGRVWADGGSFESHRPGITEWVQAQPDGLEHGYTLHRSPPGTGPVAIEIEVAGGVPTALPDGAQIAFTDHPQRLKWQGLLSWDARGVELPSRVEVQGQRIRVEVDDEGATWPITIDPTLLVEIDSPPSFPGTLYGFAIDSDGDRLIVGAPDGDTGGLARIISRPLWSPELLDASPGTRDQLGTAVAIEGHWAAVGSPDGLIQIYRRDAEQNLWTQQHTVTATDGSLLGSALDLADNLLIVGTPLADVGAADAGSVRVYGSYDINPDSWYQETIHITSAMPAGARLGEAVAADDGRIVAGAPGASRAIILRRNAEINYLFSQTAILGTASIASYGAAVDIWEDWVAVGAPDAGQVFTYENTRVALTGLNDTWVQRTVNGPPIPGREGFGSAVAIMGETLAVTDKPIEEPASLYIFEYSGGKWVLRDLYELGETSQTLPITLTETMLAVGLPDRGEIRVWSRRGEDLVEATLSQSPTAGDQFGASVAIDGDLLAVGAPSDTVGVPAQVRGSVSLFTRSGTSWLLSEVIEGSNLQERFGEAVSLDSPWLAVGAPGYGGGAGRAEVFLADGSPNTGTVSSKANLLGTSCITEGAATAEFGSAVAIDSYGLIVGAPLADSNGVNNSGAACVFANSKDATGWFALPEIKPSTSTAGDRMGNTVGIHGGRLFLGSGRFDGPMGIDAGRVEVFEIFSRNDDEFTLMATIDGGSAGDRLGTSMSISGDLVALGAPGANSNSGAVLLYQIANDISEEYDLVYSITNPQGVPIELGRTVALSGRRVATTNALQLPKSVYVYEFRVTDWRSLPRYETTATTNVHAIAMSDDWLVVGFRDEDEVDLLSLTAEGPPVARDDVFTINEDSGTFLSPLPVSANDTDPDGDLITIVSSSSDDGVTLQLGGRLVYTPPADFFGSVSLDYTIEAGGEQDQATATILVQNVPDAPVAVDDPEDPSLWYEVPLGEVLEQQAPGVLGNDYDVDEEPITAHLVGPALPGLTLGQNGSVRFVPTADGEFSFSYVARDSTGRNSAPATVRIRVINRPPVAVASQDFETDEDVQLVVGPPGLLSSEMVQDPEGDPIVVTVVTPPEHGNFLLTGIGAFIYTPDPDFYTLGEDTVVLQYADAAGHLATNQTVLEFTVNAVNDPPVAQEDGPFSVPEDGELRLNPSTLLQNDADVENQSLVVEVDLAQPPEHGTFAKVGAEYIYTPDPDYSGEDIAWYKASDGQDSSAPAPIRITVQPINDPPVVLSRDLGSVTDLETGNVLDGATDPEGDSFVARLAVPPMLGRLELAEDGTFTYTPFAGVDGEDAFQFVAVDAQGASSAPGEVRMEVRTEPEDGGGEDPNVDPNCERVLWYLDGDGDKFGNPDVMVEACEAPPGYVRPDSRDPRFDCNDDFKEIAPDAHDIPFDGIDQDCDGYDSQPRPEGTCSTAGSSSLPSLAVLGLTLVLLRRRGVR